MVSNPPDESEAVAPVSPERCEVNQAEIARLQQRWVVELEQMERFHRWLEGLASGAASGAATLPEWWVTRAPERR